MIEGCLWGPIVTALHETIRRVIFPKATSAFAENLALVHWIGSFWATILEVRYVFRGMNGLVFGNTLRLEKATSLPTLDPHGLT